MSASTCFTAPPYVDFRLWARELLTCVCRCRRCGSSERFSITPLTPSPAPMCTGAAGLATGTLYPILLRLESAGWFVSRWENVDPTAVGRPRKRFYRLTAAGLAQASEVFVGLNLGKGVPA